VSSLLQDLRFSLRTLIKSPGFTAVTVVTLALGIGASVTIFSVLDGVMLHGTGFPEAGRLVDVTAVSPEDRDKVPPGQSGGTSPLTAYDAWRTARDVVDGAAAAIGDEPILAGSKNPERVTSWSATSSLFPLLGAGAERGRLLESADDRVGAPRVAVLSDAFWRGRFGADPNIIGRTITLDTLEYTVVGVAAPGFRYPGSAQMWTGLGSLLAGPRASFARNAGVAHVVLRLRPGVTIASARPSLDRVSRAAYRAGTLHRALLPVIRPLSQALEGDLPKPLAVLTGAVAALLLLAAVNVAGLLLARGLRRAPELAVRGALGASRMQIARLALVESVVIATAAAALGIALALWAVHALTQLAGTEIPAVFTVAVDARALAVGVGVALLIGIAAGVVPAWYAARQSRIDLVIGARASEPGTRRRTLDWLLGAQVAMTVALLAGAALLARTLQRLNQVPLGFNADRVVEAEVRLPSFRYSDAGRRMAFAIALQRRVTALPGVDAAGIGSGIPFAGAEVTGDISVGGRSIGESGPWAWVSSVTPGYFAALGVPILRGVTPGDANDPNAVVIDSAAARAYFHGQEALGREITYEGSEHGIVVGIAGDVTQEGLREPPPPHIYRRLAGSSYLHIVVRGSLPAGTIAGEIREAIHAVDPQQPIERVAVLRDVVRESFARERLVAVLLGVFAALALGIAASGLYAAAAFGVERRRREVGVRIAIGAAGMDVVRSLLGRTIVIAGAGAACGTAIAVIGSRVLRGLLFGVAPRDPAALAFAVLGTAVVVVFATLVPTRRATKIDPVEALRSE